jgi:GUN4-like/CHAT domain/AAA ATPase domain
MRILHLELKLQGDDNAELRYFWDSPNLCEIRQLTLSDISEKRREANKKYYTILQEVNAITGVGLYNWLDGAEHLLERALNKHRQEGIVLAIAASGGLAHLPWEVLHDGHQFLVQRIPAIVPVRWVGESKQITVREQPANRALNVLFMATSPQGVEPELDYETEEGSILDATKRQPLNLVVEESGCLEELGYLVEEQEKGYFDVIHITGHATIRDEIPCFITETPYGDPKYSTAKDIAKELQFQHPKLIFLSGCRTGYNSEEGTVPSMAEELLRLGATAVLGWGERVLDNDATSAAAALYQELSAGKTITEALAATYQALIQDQTKDWHLLRLYVGDIFPGALVKRGRKPAARRSVTSQFLDPDGRVRVASRENFVGRRRQLQNCLRTLKTDYDKVGILVHGFGGLGKSTIASRVCDRLTDHEKLIWWRQVDSVSLVCKLADQLRSSAQRVALREDLDELKYRLKDLFEELNKSGQKPFLLIFDDFEWNLEHRDGRYILKLGVVEVLDALVWAIQESSSKNRILITCRYEVQSDLMTQFYIQRLDSFRKSDLKKKLRQLEYFNLGKIEETLVNQALQLADGNPRLLEFLNDEVLSQRNVEEKLDQLRTNPEDWKGRVIWPELYEQIDQPLEKVLSYCLVFELPVPRVALEAVCKPLPGYQKQLDRAIELGLMEVSSEFEESQRTYRVSRILPHIISSIQPPQVPEVYELCRNGLAELRELWANKNNRNEEQWQEIFRLLFADKENPLRFRQGFYQMLVVQFNAESDKVFEVEFRRAKADLNHSDFCTHLEEYLQQQKWREADEETTWIFYQLMVLEEFRDWNDLLKRIPSSLFQQIDDLWFKYSNGHFGFSVQQEIWEDLGGKPGADHETWKRFRKVVGWHLENENGWRSSNEVKPSIEKLERGNLPAVWAEKTNFTNGVRLGFRRQSTYFRSSFVSLMYVNS